MNSILERQRERDEFFEKVGKLLEENLLFVTKLLYPKPISIEEAWE